MIIYKETLKQIEIWEGLRLTSYRCAAGIWTIGIGSTMIDGEPVRQGMTITKEKAYELLEHDLQQAAEQIEAVLAIKTNNNQMNALVSFVHNVGIGNLKKSTLLKQHNIHNFENAAEGFLLYSKYRDPKTGKLVFSDWLYKRRKWEKKMYLRKVDYSKFYEFLSKLKPLWLMKIIKNHPITLKNQEVFTDIK